MLRKRENTIVCIGGKIKHKSESAYRKLLGGECINIEKWTKRADVQRMFQEYGYQILLEMVLCDRKMAQNELNLGKMRT